MLCVDASVLVYAHRADLPEHAEYRRLLGSPTTMNLSVCRISCSVVSCVMTNRRIFRDPMSSDEACQAIAALLAAPAAMRLRAGERHWVLFRAARD